MNVGEKLLFVKLFAVGKRKTWLSVRGMPLGWLELRCELDSKANGGILIDWKVDPWCSYEIKAGNDSLLIQNHRFFSKYLSFKKTLIVQFSIYFLLS